MIFKITLESERYPLTHEEIEMDLEAEQVGYITSKMILGKTTPLYSTTKAKKKYGDCLIGNIISIKQK